MEEQNMAKSHLQLEIIKQKNELERKKWRGRRTMSWIALYSMIALTVILLFAKNIPDSRIQILAEPLTWFYLCMTSIIGAYMGVTTWASRSNVK